MTKILKATHEGELKIGSIIIPCSVLEGDIRVLSRRGVNSALSGSSGGGSHTESVGGRNLPRILGSRAVKAHISNELMAGIEKSYEFHPKHGGRTAIGFEATLLPMMCEAILDADKAETLKNKDAANIANMLIRGFARVGIIALVDEATGFQAIRDKEALQKVLDLYLQDYAKKWAKTFPDEFWIKLLKIKGYPSVNFMKRPSYVGHWVNDIVYDRLAPGIRQKLKELNPKTETGYKKNKDHQFLTKNHGVPELKDHLTKVMVLMDASANEGQFDRLLNRSLPKFGENLEMPFDEEQKKAVPANKDG